MSFEDNNKGDTTSFKPSEPALCANDCGFFGTAATNNLCSKCYKDMRIKEEHAASAKVVVDKFVNKITPARPAVEPAVREVAGEPEAKKPNRCSSCKKKIGVLGFKCRCGSMFCGTHRYPEKHECGFDYKAAGKEEIAKANPVVKADKLIRM